MNKLAALMMTALVAVSLVGCININGEKKALNDYRRAKLDKPLDIPEGLNGNNITDYYAIPPVRVGLVDVEAEIPEPPALALADEGNLVRIQKFSGDSWVLVQLVPGQVWPLAMQFASENGIVITREQAGQGFLESGWLQKQSDNNYREKYRFLIQQGVQRGSTEIRVQQYETLAGGESATIDWRKRAIDQESADVTLRALAEYMATYADPTAAVSLRAQNVNTAPRILLKADGNTRISVELDDDRGFASTRFALEKSNFIVSDFDLSKGQIYASSALNAQRKKGLRSMLGFGKKTIWPDHDYIFYVKESSTKGWIDITVESNKKLNNKEAKSILKQVKRNFS